MSPIFGHIKMIFVRIFVFRPNFGFRPDFQFSAGISSRTIWSKAEFRNYAEIAEFRQHV